MKNLFSAELVFYNFSELKQSAMWSGKYEAGPKWPVEKGNWLKMGGKNRIAHFYQEMYSIKINAVETVLLKSDCTWPDKRALCH